MDSLNNFKNKCARLGNSLSSLVLTAYCYHLQWNVEETGFSSPKNYHNLFCYGVDYTIHPHSTVLESTFCEDFDCLFVANLANNL